MIISRLNKTEPWPFRDVKNLKFGSVWSKKPGQSCMDVMLQSMVVRLVMPHIISQDAPLLSTSIPKKTLNSFGERLRVAANASS